MQLVSKITLATFDFNKHLTIKELSHVTSYNTLKVINFASKFRNFSKNKKQNFHWISIFLLLINVIVIKYVTETNFITMSRDVRNTGINIILWSNINPFSTNVPLLYPLKTSENRRLFDVFRGYRNGTLVENGLRKRKSQTRQVFNFAAF